MKICAAVLTVVAFAGWSAPAASGVHALSWSRKQQDAPDAISGGMAEGEDLKDVVAFIDEGTS